MPKIKLLQSFTVFIVAPLFLIVLICFALVCASGLFLLFQRFLLGPGLLPIFSLFFFLLGEGGFLLCSLENWESDATLDAAMTCTILTCDEKRDRGTGSGTSLPESKDEAMKTRKKMCSQPSLPVFLRLPRTLPLKSTVYFTTSLVIIHPEKERINQTGALINLGVFIIQSPD